MMNTKISNYSSKITKRGVLFLSVFFILFSCKKEARTSDEPAEIKKEKPVESKNEKLKQLTLELLSLARNKAFTALVFNECKKQKYGDYNVRIEELFNNNAISTVATIKEKNSILALVNDLKKGGFRNPIIFYPSVETKENIQPSVSGRQQSNDEEVVGVLDDGSGGGGGNGVGYTNDQYPGYTFNTNGQLQYSQQITEEFAWNHDVWVIGDEENCSEGNMVAAPEDFTINPDVARFQGQPEYGAIIQVPDIGQIESWISGKLEMKMTVLNSSGVIILGPLGLGKVKRKYFKDSKWYDYNKFIGNWNTSTFGNWMYEHWMEEDGGQSNSTTITAPPPPGISGPTITTSIPSRNLDDDLGRATIQFTDAGNQVYNITYANIKRKN